MQEKFLITFAYAKINLGLAILGLREDGYHELQTVMQSIDLHDVVKVRRSGDSIVCRCGSLSGPTNLAFKAAELFCQRLGINEGLEIEIEKNIPVQAGLAGGSSDAAATLRALNQIFGNPFSGSELADFAGQIGSDVAFCLTGGTKWATGRGENLRDLPAAPVMDIVLVKPEQGVNTGEAYRLFDSLGTPGRLDFSVWEQVLKSGRVDEVAAILSNDLEQASLRLLPEIGTIKQALLDSGCYASLMSGSGSAVFGIARGEEHAMEVIRLFKMKGYQVWRTKTVPGVEKYS